MAKVPHQLGVTTSSTDPEFLAGIWNRAAGKVFPVTPALMAEITTCDPSFEPGDLLFGGAHGDRPHGFAIAKRFRRQVLGGEDHGDAGFVSLLAVDPTFAGQGLGSALLAAAEDSLRQDGATRAILGGSYFHALPGVPAELAPAIGFFERAGYRAGKTVWDVARDVKDFVVPPEVRATMAAGGIEARLVVTERSMSYEPIRTAALLEFLAAEFPGRWLFDVAFSLGRAEAPASVVVLFDGLRAVGFAHLHPPRSPGSLRWQGFDPEVAAIGPVGVARAYQGRGLGLAVVAIAAEVLRKQKARRVVIDWTDLLGFYGRLGFAPWLSYQLMEKPLLP